MFIDPSMGGQIYNPWRSHAPVLQRFGTQNPTSDQQPQAKKKEQESTNFRFYGGGEQQPQNQMHQIFRSFF